MALGAKGDLLAGFALVEVLRISALGADYLQAADTAPLVA